MKKNKKLLIGLVCLFAVLLGTTLFVSFSSLLDTQEVVVKSMTPVYDETSGVVVNDEGVVFNDKNQTVKYNVVLENTQDYDVKISDIKLSTPSEEFLDYKVEGISADDVVAANSTKELVVSFETMGIKDWGRNFADELTANISFEKVVKQEEVTPPADEDKEEEKQPEAPATNIEEIVKEAEKIEVNSIINNTIEFKDGIKLEDVEKAETWIYPETEFYGYKEADESNTIKEIVLEKDKLDELEINPGEHNIVLTTEEKEVLGYVNIYINKDKELLKEKPQESTDKEESDVINKEESNTEGSVPTKPSTDSNNKEENKEDNDKVENPYTSDKGLIIVLGIATCITGLAIIIVSKNKFAKYTVFILMLSPAFTITNAEEVIEVAIKNNVSFESQNVMDIAYDSEYEEEEVCREYCSSDDGCEEDCYERSVLVEEWFHYWEHRDKIKNIYFINEIIEIAAFEYEYDVTEAQNGRVMAYLVKNNVDSNFYDLYLVADGIIYPNANVENYFNMPYLETINNLENLDTSVLTSMYKMFSGMGSNVVSLTLDLSSFDTSNVTHMGSMFYKTGYNSENFTLDVSNFDTSKVKDMSSMFDSTGYSSTNFTLDVSSFDTSNVTNMRDMFNCTGYSSTNFTLDVSSFDTSNVTEMSWMFDSTGYNSTKLDTSITIKNPNLKYYSGVFDGTATKTGSQIIVNYTSKTSELVDNIIATKTEGANVVKGSLREDDNLYIGEVVTIGNEKFNVISTDSETVTMLAQYNLGTDYRQTTESNYVTFSDNAGWEFEPGPKEIDIQNYEGNVKTYINEYVSYLKTETGDSNITGDLITLSQLGDLGCERIYDDYSSSKYLSSYCSSSGDNGSWLVNKQIWWTRSSYSGYSCHVWSVDYDEDYDEEYDTSYQAEIQFHYYRDYKRGVRPVITISKDTLKNLN